MTTIPPTGRRLTGVVNVSSAVTALTALALLGGTMSTAVAQPTPSVTALAGVSTAAAASSAVIGSASLSVTGTNVAREVNALVVYQSPVTRTTTNMWGVEVTVVNGKVSAVNDRERARNATGTTVPAAGYVLSGHGTAADWLRTHAKVGATVSGVVPTTPVPTTPVPTLAPPTGSAVIGSASLAVAGSNVARDLNALVVYQSPLKVTTTNMWGVEASVVNGKVSAVNDREPTRSTAGTTVPTGGYLLSGHGTAAQWLRTHAKVGATVSNGPSTPVPTTPVPTTPVPTTPVPTTPAPTTPPPVGSTAPMALPVKVEALYHMMWSNSGSPQLRNTPAQVNVVNLAFLQGGGTPSMVGWGSQSEASFVADAKVLRARGVRMVISAGGAGGALNISNREAFVQGVMNLNAKLPLDGLDWDIEGAAMGSSDVVWISKRLKELRGNNFAITMAPNGSNIDQYRAIAVELNRQGALDMIGQQFYDAVVSKEAANGRVAQLVAAGIPQSKIAVGMMVGDANTYWTVEECMQAYQFIKGNYPGIRGGYLWEAGRAGTADWANRMSGMLKS